MTAISPHIASDLALAAYEIKGPVSKGHKLEVSSETYNNFSFDLSKNVLKGTSGGFFWRQETGFALIGQGKSQQFKNDHVIAIRGTDTAADTLTDLTCHSTSSYPGNSVHTGFQRSFASLRPSIAQYINQPSVLNSQGIIHCIGHSLGGALASLTADWIKHEFGKKVYLYTFGAPRVGKKDYAIQTSTRVDKIFRCVHGADPVPKIPIWPFHHAPFNGEEYLLARTQGIDANEHSMPNRYIHTANGSHWESLYKQSSTLISQRVVLNYQNRLQTTYSTHWADKIAAALMTVMIDGGGTAIMAGLQTGGASIGTIYDIMAKSLVNMIKITDALKEQVKGLLGHMLVFAGKGANITIELTEKFIRWVFRVTIGRLNKAARQALNQNK